MPCYIISYDLRKPGRNYQRLFEAIKSYGSWAHPLESTWAVATPKTAEQVWKHLMRYMDSNDGLLVVRAGREAGWDNVGGAEVDSWLQSNL